MEKTNWQLICLLPYIVILFFAIPIAIDDLIEFIKDLWRYR